VIINLSFHRLHIKQEILECGEESPRGGGGVSREQAGPGGDSHLEISVIPGLRPRTLEYMDVPHSL
jgi:hypothetical protein